MVGVKLRVAGEPHRGGRGGGIGLFGKNARLPIGGSSRTVRAESLWSTLERMNACTSSGLSLDNRFRPRAGLIWIFTAEV